jgi:hypothetical protein
MAGMEFAVPEPTWTEAVLEPVQRATKGDDATHADPLPGRIALGRPVALRLAAEGIEDKELRSFVEGYRDRSNFTLVHLACSFRAEPGTSFTRASVQVRLSRSDDSEAPEPIAWSMLPDRQTSDCEASTKVQLGANAKLLSATLERTVTVKRADLFIEALNELRSDPGWEFTRTASVEISGAHRLALVVMSDSASGFEGDVEASATVRDRFLRLIPYRARPVDGEMVRFICE